MNIDMHNTIFVITTSIEAFVHAGNRYLRDLSEEIFIKCMEPADYSCSKRLTEKPSFLSRGGLVNAAVTCWAD